MAALKPERELAGARRPAEPHELVQFVDVVDVEALEQLIDLAHS